MEGTPRNVQMLAVPWTPEFYSKT